MRRLAAKKSRRRNDSGGPVSLFPFLAVLICTMGSLILLLVVIARQARLQASERPVPDHEELRAEIDQELEMVRLQTMQFDESRKATHADLEHVRLKLGQIEDHSGQLRRQMAALQAAWAELDQLESNEESAKSARESELAELSVKIRQLQREVELAKVEAEGREAAYSIVPYEGPHGTKRRPIYIECRADGLVLQPEGVYFGVDDFEGPLDAGNPLDVGLRAVREYLAVQQGVLKGEKSEPYPLLLVRPSGIAYFYAGRTAMKSWGTEYGYELIGDDWKLDFSEPDPELARVIRDAVEPARRRQRRLIAAAPSRYGGGGDSRPVYTVKPYRGGIASRGGGRGDEEPSSLSLRPNSRSGGRPGSYFGQQPSGAAEESPYGSGQLAGGQAGQESQSFFGKNSQQSGGESSASSGRRFGQPGGEGGSYFGRGSGQPTDKSGTFAGGGGTQPDGEGEASSKGVSSPPGVASAERGSGQAGGGGGVSGEACENPGGQASAFSPGQNSQAAQSLAKNRGRNWGLPDANHTAVAITRPVRVECHADRLVIVPEKGLGQPSTISLARGTAASIDTFVSSVWDYMETWGRAGRGMYWRPVLNVYLGPGADPRVAELEALLQDSGLLVSQAGRLTTLQ